MSDDTDLFLDFLSRPMSEFPDKPNLPANKHFYGKLVSLEMAQARNERKTPMYRFRIQITDPSPDVPRDWLDQIKNLGFSLSDFIVTADFFATFEARQFLKRFVISLGFAENVNVGHALRLSMTGGTAGMPTEESQEAIRGLEVYFQTRAPDEKGRVFNNVDSTAISGAKR